MSRKVFLSWVLAILFLNLVRPAAADIASGGSFTLEKSLTSATRQSASGGVYSLVGSIGEGFSHVSGDNQAAKAPLKRVYDGFLLPLKVDSSMTNSMSISGGAIQLSFPAGTIPKAYEAMVETSVGATPIAADPTGFQQAGQKLVALLGSFVSVPLSIIEVRILMDDNTLLSDQGNGPDTLVMNYSDRGDGGTIFIDHFNESAQTWEKISGGESITGSSSRFTIMRAGVYALFQGPALSNTPYAFPVPWRPNHDNSSLYGTLREGITFANLGSGGSIQIYNLAGELVRALSIPAGSLQVKWDGKTDGGSTTASGVYIWTVESGRGRQTGKLMIIR